MPAHLRLVSVPILAACGAALGMLVAAGDLSGHGYLRQGLHRTALWAAAEHSLDGALRGGALGLIVFLLMVAPWLPVFGFFERVIGSRRGEEGPKEPPSLQGPAIVFVLLCCIAAGFFVPSRGPTRLYLPYVVVLVAAVGAVWVIVMAAAARTSLRPPNNRSRAWLKLRWLAVVSTAYAVIALHIWVAGGDKFKTALIGLGTLAVAIAIYRLLWPVAEAVDSALKQGLGKRRSVWFSRLVKATCWTSLLVLLLTASLQVAGARARWLAQGEAAATGRNVILISVDTLRADRVSAIPGEAAERDLTPNVRKWLGSRGTVFSYAMSQAPWTLPAHASVLTGLYPEQHQAERLTDKLDPSQLTLAEILREAGYHTMGVVSSGLVSSRVHMDQGFVEFDESQRQERHGSLAIVSDKVTEIALDMLKRNRARPFFLLAHYYDPHSAYMDHAEYDFADGYRGWLREEAHAGGNQPLILLRAKRHLLGPEEHAFIRNLYDEEVAYSDAHVGALLEYVDSENLWESTLVIFVSDHGEEFFEHGWIGHTINLYDEAIKVPLVVADPDSAGPQVVASPVEIRWLFGTILDFVGLSPPDKAVPSLPTDADSPAVDPWVRSSTFPEDRMDTRFAKGGRHVKLSCIADGRWKLIRDHLMDRTYLFDLITDPGEMHDLSSDQPDLRRRLEDVLSARDAEVSQGTTRRPMREIDEEHLQDLKSLGYM